ncbi:MAG TPA: hypothetical protein VE422_48440 [Terriglobia bacterium]|nr:hypothetical protein [Terriglobia bacterium]
MGHERFDVFRVGDQVRILGGWRSPLSGYAGTIVEISTKDSKGPYLVEFDNGLRYRYHVEELRMIHQRTSRANLGNAK